MATDFKFKLKEKVIAFFDQNSIQEATCRQIAEWIIKAYPNDCAQKMANSNNRRAIDNNKKLAVQISAEINGYYIRTSHILLREGLERVKINGLLGLRRTKSISNTKTINSNSFPKTINTNPKPKTNKKIDEEDMYDPLIKFLSSKHGIRCKRVEHRNAKKRGRGGDMWLYPDLVGLEDLSGDWSSRVRECVKLYSDKMSKLWSFELKKEITVSNVREYFFQAVSNSSWANLGYLVACEINDESLKELQILSSLHGIGFIKLNIRKSLDSQIIIPAQEKREIDWNIVNRLEKNKDFQNYIALIKSAYKLDSDERKTKWDSDN